MSREKIGVVVAVVVAVLTGAAYMIVAGRIDAAVGRELEQRVGRAQSLFTQLASLESLDIMARAQSFSRDETLRTVIEDPAARQAGGKAAIERFHASLGPGAARPDFTAIVDAKGALVFADSPLPDSQDFKSRFKAVAAALDRGQVSKDIWDYGKNTVRVGVAPVLVAGAPIGAVIVAYAINAKEAVEHAASLGTDVVYFAGDRVLATSFRRALIDDLAKHPDLQKLAADALAGGRAAATQVDVGGEPYMAAAGALPLNFDNRATGALVLASVDAERGQFSFAKVVVILLGVATLLVALFAMWVTARLILHQSDDIEAGVAEIINGDVDYTFKPVGADFDGLANSLNVMLARLLGRPEPGEGEGELDADSTPARVMLEVNDGGSAATRMSQDPDVVALAREGEPEYMRRVYEEYVAARRSVGESVEGVTFESFSAKLRLSEANLRKKYNCKAVRFRVQTSGNQVSLKPVPIL